MIKSVCIETIFTEVCFEERFGLARKSGFDYVEFWSWQDKDLELIKELCARYSLHVASFSGDQSHSLINAADSQEYFNFVKLSLEKARFLGCKYLVLHSNALGEGGVVDHEFTEISDSKKFETMVNVLKTLAPLVEKEQVTLVLEALNTKVDHVGNFLASTKVAAEVVRQVSSHNIKLLYDVYHMQIMEGNIINTIKDNLDVIGYIHIADVPGRHEPGTGEINYVNVMHALRTLQYDGVAGFELFPQSSSTQAAKIILNL